MRIKNIGKCTIVFKGGKLESGRVAVFKGEAESIGKALLRVYPRNLENIDDIKNVVEVKAEAKAEAKTAAKAKKKAEE